MHACMVADEGMKKLLETTREGVPLITIYSGFVQAMMAKALFEVDDLNLIASKFQGAVWPPSISHDPHIIPTAFMPMEEGGPSCSIVSAIVDGYGVEVERTLFLEYVPDHAKKLFDVMMKDVRWPISWRSQALYWRKSTGRCGGFHRRRL